MVEYGEFYRVADIVMEKLEQFKSYSDQIATQLVNEGVISNPESELLDDIVQWLIDKGYIQCDRNYLLSNTALGRDILRIGGFEKHLAIENAKKLKIEKKDSEEERLRKLNLFNAERQKVTFYISIITACITAILSFLKLAETFKFWPY